MYKRYLAIMLVLIAIVMAISFCKKKEPVPPVPELVEELQLVYMPIMLNDECGFIDKRFGLAWAGRSRDVRADLRLCISDGAMSHNWDWNGGYFGARNLVDLPMLWGAEYLDEWMATTQPDSSNIHLGPNECDRPDQCNLPVDEVAQLMVAANQHCPDCQWVGPSYSMAKQCELLPEFFRLYQEYGGDIDAFIGIGIHIYTNINGVDVDAILQRCRDILPQFTETMPFWVTEFGIVSCDTDPHGAVSSVLDNLVEQLESRKDVARYMIYSPYHYRRRTCDFTPLFDWYTNAITPAGSVFTK